MSDSEILDLYLELVEEAQEVRQAPAPEAHCLPQGQPHRPHRPRPPRPDK